MKTLVELNKEIIDLETKLKDLKMQRMFLTGKRGRIFYVGNSYTSRRSVESVLRNTHSWAPLRENKQEMQKAAVLKATNGATDDVQKIKTFEEWASVELIYLNLLKEYVEKSKLLLKKTKSV